MRILLQRPAAIGSLLQFGSEWAKLRAMLDTIVSNSVTNRDSHWFALQTHSRHEKIVREELTRRNIEQFLPTVKRLSQWKDRKKEIEFPLFPGYCFARFPLHNRLPVLQSPGVVRIVGALRPEPIPESEIESLKIVMDNRVGYEVYPYLQEGSLVEVTEGPLQGVTGVLVRHARPYRLILRINLIQRALAVEVDSSSVVPTRSLHIGGHAHP